MWTVSLQSVACNLQFARKTQNCVNYKVTEEKKQEKKHEIREDKLNTGHKGKNRMGNEMYSPLTGMYIDGENLQNVAKVNGGIVPFHCVCLG